MPLKGQDVALSAAIAILNRPMPYAEMAKVLALSLSDLHASTQRAIAARLLSTTGHSLRDVSVMRANLVEFLHHGLKYAFYARIGGEARGVPTASAAPGLRRVLAESSGPPAVWPHRAGTVRGFSLEPLYAHAADAALARPELHELFALMDSVRVGGARERDAALAALRMAIQVRG